MRGWTVWIIAVAALVAGWPLSAGAQPGNSPTATLSQAIRLDWGMATIWEDGNAEVATYDGERVIYGAARPHELRLITVKEDLNKEYYTKADYPYGQKPLLTAIKQNQVATIPTPNYPYHYMVSLFFDRSSIRRMVKMVVSSQEWCGTTFKEFQLHKEPAVWIWSSYWDQQGSNREALPAASEENVFFEEELPLLVRTLKFREGLEVTLGLMPNQTTNKAETPQPSAALLKVARPAQGMKALGRDYPASRLWEVHVDARDGRSLTFLVSEAQEDGTPEQLLAFEMDDGRRYLLKDLTRRQYWRLGG